MDKDFDSFLGQKELFLLERIGKGHSSHIFLVKDSKGKKLVAKVERSDSTRFNMAEREAENLEKANKLGVGPKLKGFDLKKRIILMEYIQGPCFSKWLFSGPNKAVLKRFIKELQKQVLALDKAGLDHGQLAGRGKNILVRKDKPVIIDFEKASCQRKCHNFNAIEAFLFRNPHGAVAKKVRKILKIEVKEFTS